MPPQDLATHIMEGIETMTMTIIMIGVIFIQTQIILEEHNRVMTLMI